MGTRTTVRTALADRLERYDAVVEVGVGDRTAVASELAARGRDVTVTDVDPPIDDHPDDPPASETLPSTVTVVRDDVTDPDPGVYAAVDAIYALRCPPELQRPLSDLANAVDATCLFTTLGTDPAIVPATTETLPGTRVTLHVARDAGDE